MSLQISYTWKSFYAHDREGSVSFGLIFHGQQFLVILLNWKDFEMLSNAGLEMAALSGTLT